MPPPRTKGPGRCASEGPCDPLAHKQAVKNPEKEGTKPSALEALPWPPLGPGAGEITRCPLRRDHLLGLKKCSRKTKQEGEKETQSKRSTENPCRLASQGKGLRRSKENPKNARGQEWHPEKTTKKRDARPKRAKQTKAAGHKKQGTSKTSACEGVSCYYLIFVS